MAWSFRATSAPLLEPKRNLDLLGGPNLLWIRTERARVRSVFNDARASSLCLAPWDTQESLSIFESAEIQQPITNHLKASLSFRGNPQGCMQSLPGKAPCFKLSASTRHPAGCFSADIPCRCIRRTKKAKRLKPVRHEISFFIIFWGFMNVRSKKPEWWKEAGCLKRSLEVEPKWHHIESYHIVSCHVMPGHATSCCSRFARSNSRTRESSRHGDSDWTTSGVDRCYFGNMGRLLDPGEPWSMPRFTRLR